MNSFRHRQRGEGKIGCVFSLLTLITLAAAGYKAVPVFWGNYELKDAAKDFATRASVMNVETIDLQLRTKAKELDIAEALAPGAMQVTRRGDHTQGTCSIRLRYQRKIDFYGIYTWTVVTNEDVTSQYISAI